MTKEEILSVAMTRGMQILASDQVNGAARAAAVLQDAIDQTEG